MGFVGVVLLLMAVLMFFSRGYFVSGFGGNVLSIVWVMLIFLFLILGVILISLYMGKIRERRGQGL